MIWRSASPRVWQVLCSWYWCYCFPLESRPPFMASRYSRPAPHTVSFEDIMLPQDFTGNPSSPTRNSTSMAEEQQTSQPTPLFSPEQQAWIEALIQARTSQPQSLSRTAPPTASSSSSSLTTRPGNIGKSFSINENVLNNIYPWGT